MSFDTCDHLSEKAAAVLKRLGDSGDSQSYAVAECLNDIAGNGAEYADDVYIVGCAEEVMKAAQAVIKELSPPPQPKRYNPEKDGEEFALIISKFLNSYSSEHQNAAVAKMIRDHRSLQQAMMRFFMLFVAAMAKNSSDGRNEAAVNLAKEIMALPERVRTLPKI